MTSHLFSHIEQQLFSPIYFYATIAKVVLQSADYLNQKMENGYYRKLQYQVNAPTGLDRHAD